METKEKYAVTLSSKLKQLKETDRLKTIELEERLFNDRLDDFYKMSSDALEQRKNEVLFRIDSDYVHTNFVNGQKMYSFRNETNVYKKLYDWLVNEGFSVNLICIRDSDNWGDDIDCFYLKTSWE
jgi:hypothetical protein